MKKLLSVLLIVAIAITSLSTGFVIASAESYGSITAISETQTPEKQFNFKLFFRKLINSIYSLFGLNDRLYATGINIVEENISAENKSTVQLTLEVLPKGARMPEIIWSTEHHTQAEVDQNGLVTLKYIGYADIQAKTKDGLLSDICRINITKEIVTCKDLSVPTYEEISFDGNFGKTIECPIQTVPSLSTDSYSCTSSNPEVLSVELSYDTMGFCYIKTTPLKAGKSTVTITCGNVSKSYDLVVSEVGCTEIRPCDFSYKEVTVETNKPASYRLYIYPFNHTDIPLVISSDESVLTGEVIDNILYITPLKEGKSTVSLVCGEAYYELYFTIKKSHGYSGGLL